jgi:hypothetical protein
VLWNSGTLEPWNPGTYSSRLNKIIKYSLIAFGIMLMVFIPANLVFQEKIPLCIFKYLTGIECPLCGMTRACYSIMHLHLSDAFAYNPVSLMIPLIVVAEIGYDLTPSDRLKKLRQAVLILFLVCLSVLFLIRIVRFFGV